MSMLSDLLGRAKNALGIGKAPKPESVNAIDSTSFDRDEWQRILSGSTEWQKETLRLAETNGNAAELLEDLHAGLYRMSPMLLDAAEMAETHKGNHAIMSEMVKLPEFDHLRQFCAGDAYASAIAMGAMQEALTEAQNRIEEARQDAEQRRQDAEQRAQDAVDAIQQAMDAVADAETTGDPDEQQAAHDGLAAALDQFDMAQQDEQQAEQDAAAATASAVRAEKRGLREVTTEATDAIEEEKNLMAAYGVSPGELVRMPPEERLALAERLRNDRLAEFAKTLGAFKPVQKAESRKRVKQANDHVYGLELSNHLNRMVISEYMALAHPVTKAQLMVRYAGHRLVTQKMRGRQKGGQGPIIVVCDESGSMEATDVGGASREAWSKGFALALLDQARRRDRDFIYIGFAETRQQHVIEYPKGVTTIDKVLEMTSHFWKGGGTDFEVPLTMALDIVEKYASAGKPRPDIVLLTDGQAPITEQFLTRYREAHRRTSLKTYGIAIGVSSRGTLDQVCDTVHEITEMVNDPRTVGDIFTTV